MRMFMYDMYFAVIDIWFCICLDFYKKKKKNYIHHIVFYAYMSFTAALLAYADSQPSC